MNFRSELLVIRHDSEIKQVGIPKRYSNSSCTWPFVDEAVGLKICAEYSLPDVSNSTSYPSLILSGPLNINVHLDKADLTAKDFVFEYRSTKNQEQIIRTLIFETPNSVIPRRFSANVTSNDTTYDIGMEFVNGKTEHNAVGLYKNTENDKRLEFTFNTQGKSNMGFQIGLNKTDVKHGAIYRPLFYLMVKDVKIAGIGGTVKKNFKQGKLQYDLDVVFETRKLKCVVTGTLSKSEVTYSSNLQVEYEVRNLKLLKQ